MSNYLLERFFFQLAQLNFPFAFYRLPQTKEVKIVAQKSSDIHFYEFNSTTVNSKGFLFSPFVENKFYKSVLIQADIFCREKELANIHYSKKGKTETIYSAENITTCSKEDYLRLVTKCKKEISQGKLQKVVAASVFKKKKPTRFNPVIYFKQLCKVYPNAFVSLVYIEKYGLWIGATPETLLSVTGSTFK